LTTYPVRNRHWIRKEYDELIKIGFFQEDEPIELLGGQLLVAEGTPHSTAIALTVGGLRSRGPTSPSPWPICCRSRREAPTCIET